MTTVTVLGNKMEQPQFLILICKIKKTDWNWQFDNDSNSVRSDVKCIS